MRTLTPARLLFAPGQVSLIHEHALRDIPSPPTPCAPVPAMLLCSGQAWPPIRGGWLSAVLRTSCTPSSLVSRILAVSSSLRGSLSDPSVLRTILSLPVALHAASRGRSYFQLLALSSAREGLPPSNARLLSSALGRVPSPGESGPSIFLSARIPERRLRSPEACILELETGTWAMPRLDKK